VVTDTHSELLLNMTRRQLVKLADRGRPPRISISLATPPGSSVAGQRSVWMKLVRTARRQLVTSGLSSGEARALLGSAGSAIEGRHPGAQSVAFFASAQWSRALSIAIQVPSMAVVGDRFCIRPLLPLLEHTDHDRYFVLGLGRDDVRLFKGTRERVQEVSLDGLALAPFASMPRGRRPPKAFMADRNRIGASGVWHGGGTAAADVDDQRIVEHFREVDKAVRNTLAGSHHPLILAGADHLHRLYRQASSYPGLVPEGVTGGFAEMTTTRIHDQAWPLAEPRLYPERRKALASFAQLDGTGRTVTEPAAAASAADDGRIDALLVAQQTQPTGSAGARSTTLDRRLQMLLEQAIAGALRYGGSVHVLEQELMPTPEPLAAILRY
jgi:hypothetical protein